MPPAQSIRPSVRVSLITPGFRTPGCRFGVDVGTGRRPAGQLPSAEARDRPVKA